MPDADRVFDLLARSGLFRGFVQSFRNATGISIAFEPPSECLLPTREGLPLETLFSPRQVRFEEHDGKPFATEIEWMPGLFEIVVAVFAGRKLIGWLRSGFLPEDMPLRDNFERLVVTSLQDDSGAFFDAQLPVISAKGRSGATGLLLFYADYLSRFGNQLMLEQPLCEPASIARAKQYIRAHHRDNILLNEVAGHVHVSTFYFCKLFKKTTGLNFSEYLVRTRIETAKKLLLNRSHLINQVALDAGFQSLTHFNRVFKRLVGVSPRDYRKQGASVVRDS